MEVRNISLVSQAEGCPWEDIWTYYICIYISVVSKVMFELHLFLQKSAGMILIQDLIWYQAGADILPIY